MWKSLADVRDHLLRQTDGSLCHEIHLGQVDEGPIDSGDSLGAVIDEVPFSKLYTGLVRLGRS